MENFKNALFAGLAFALLFGGFMILRYGWDLGLVIGLVSGVLFGFGVYLFVNSRAVRSQTEVDLGGEQLLHSGGANHFLNGEAVGGRLYLTATRLIFKSHGFNLQNHLWECPIEGIREVRFFSPRGIVPIGLVISTRQDRTERFVVNGRTKWKQAIEAAMSAM